MTHSSPTSSQDSASIDDRDLVFLRQESLSASDQALTIKGFAVATTALLVGFALSDNETPKSHKILLFLGVQLLQVVLVLMIGARRRQHANAVAYQNVFCSHVSNYEDRIKRLRGKIDLPVDRWYASSEKLLVLVLSLIGCAGSFAQLASRGEISIWLVIATWVINALATFVAVWQATSKTTIGVLIDEAEAIWKKLD